MTRRCSPGIVAGTWLAALLALPAAHAAAPASDAAELLAQADAIKAADNATFVAIIGELGAQSRRLPERERHWLHYLQAWQLGHEHRFDAAATALEAVLREAGDDTILKFRVDLSLVDDEARASRYREAYARLAQALRAQAKVPDKRTRMLAYAVASRLYAEAGQYELALANARRWLSEDDDGVAACEGRYLELAALHRIGTLTAQDSRFGEGIDACSKLGDGERATALRILEAKVDLEAGHAQRAIDLLEGAAAADRHGSQHWRAEARSLLARCYLAVGDLERARGYASRVVAGADDGRSRASVEALDVLWRVAKAKAEYATALAYHEKYTAADKRLTHAARARAVAYQVVHQQARQRAQEVDALSEKNQLLRLQQQVIEKSGESTRLYVLLLLLVIGFVVLWTYRIRRSQQRFQRLARRDSLTGIANRQHFMDEAKVVLQACVGTRREVSLIMIDLDNFKRINDTYGHVAGDGVLRQSVEMFKLHMRADDLFGRVGGEEFGIMLADCMLETALQRAEELRVAIGGFAHAGVEITVSASFGVASTRDAGYELRRLLIHADRALYRAKHNGRDRVERYLAGRQDG